MTKRQRQLLQQVLEELEKGILTGNAAQERIASILEESDRQYDESSRNLARVGL